jgi:hypothetical protein
MGKGDLTSDDVGTSTSRCSRVTTSETEEGALLLGGWDRREHRESIIVKQPSHIWF